MSARLAVVSEFPKEEKSFTPETWDGVTDFRKQLLQFLKGKETLADALICAVLSSGHVLLEDVPGVGKTTVIKAMAKLLGLEMKRIQCTSDLLPSDIIGVEVFNPATQEFVFHEGPIFSHLILADELNRASPRTQSALLEAMGEGMVTVDRRTYTLPRPFILFAAQNPSDHLGTYPLPESQLDRFAMKLTLDYPNAEKEAEIFSLSLRDPLANLVPTQFTAERWRELQNNLEKVFISDRIAMYVKRFADATRSHEALSRGISTRAGVSWLRTSRARAVLFQREYVTPDDLIATATYCLAHRVIARAGNQSLDILTQLLHSVPIE